MKIVGQRAISCWVRIFRGRALLALRLLVAGDDRRVARFVVQADEADVGDRRETRLAQPADQVVVTARGDLRAAGGPGSERSTTAAP
ncbi:hypothetical protein [Micromonospora sp. NPDC048063]|uniref:hypothetical protein n=1 Tax=Micromonospora sp. NPDC048063 TaxID=3364256 RepID=UPI0037117F64